MTPDINRRLADGSRLDAITLTGLEAQSDASFDRFADLVRTVIGVPVALVSLVDDARQFFPGQVGLGTPWCDSRQTPLSHSFCQIVAATGEPLVITDSRTDPRVEGNLAITVLQVIAYAGIPLTDGDGNVLGSLCAIDTEPRIWAASELALLHTLADACSAELRLRIGVARTTQLVAERDGLADQVRTSLATTELLLRSSEQLGAAISLDQITEAVGQLVGSRIAPVFVGIGTVYTRDGQRHIDLPTNRPDRAPAWLLNVESGDSPILRCVRDNQPQFYADPDAVAADFPHLADDVRSIMGRRALACLPLPGPGGPIGVLLFWWDKPHVADATEQAVLAAVAGYTGQAVQRVMLLQDRIAVAETLQRAMLTDLPEPDHLELVARYHPAHAGDQVGGDWYDAFLTPAGDTTLVIGDVTGHDITAATYMGQIRSLLRSLAVDRDEPPAGILSRLDNVMSTLGVDTASTAIIARIGQTGPEDDRDLRHLTWSNAGHPPPLLIGPDGKVDVLADATHALLGLRPGLRRTTATRKLPAGSTILLYTDGLIEKRGEDIYDSVAKLVVLVESAHHLPLGELLDTLIGTLAGHHHEDDIAILACRLHSEDAPRPAEAGPAHD